MNDPARQMPSTSGKRPHLVRYGVIAAAAALIALTGCGGHIAKTGAAGTTGQPTAAAYTPPATPSPSAAPLTGTVGTTYEVTTTDDSGNTEVYQVTLVKVREHAAPDNQFDAAPAGQHLVGAEFRITGVTGTSSDDANSDAVANGTDEQAYQPVFGGLAAGTNFDSGDFNVTPGQTSIGWVAFQLPDGITAANIQWSSGLDGTPATWTT